MFSSFGSGVISFPLWLGSTSGRRFPLRPAFAGIAIWAPLATSFKCCSSARRHRLLRRRVRTCFRQAAPCCSSCVTRTLSAVGQCILACLGVYDRPSIMNFFRLATLARLPPCSGRSWPKGVIISFIHFLPFTNHFIPSKKSFISGRSSASRSVPSSQCMRLCLIACLLTSFLEELSGVLCFVLSYFCTRTETTRG